LKAAGPHIGFRFDHVTSKCHQPQHNLCTCQLRQLRLAYPLKGGGGKSMLAQNLGVKFPVPPITPPRPRNRLSATNAPEGMPKSAETATALRLTIRDSRTIASRAGSPVRINSRAEVFDCIEQPNSL
jgi:hypothetical protein